LTRGVAGIGGASLLSDLGHEVPTSLLPSFLTSTLGAPAAALGLIEGIADGCAGVARFAGGALADDPERRRRAALGGYTATAVLSSLIGVATAAWQVGILRTGAWAARGLRVPARNALLADVVPPGAYGRAYGFERSMDNLGAIGGPLLALGLVALVGTRTAILLSVIPGLLAALAILYAIRAIARPRELHRPPLQFHLRAALRGRLTGIFVGISTFELGNVAATLLILRATELLTPAHGHDRATEIALVLYIAYNAAATLAGVPGGHAGDRAGSLRVLALGVALFGVAYLGFALTGSSIATLAVSFVAAGIAIGFVETAEHATVAEHAPADLRGSAFGALAAVQSLGNLAASAVAGLLWTAVSARAAFGYLAAWMLVSLLALAIAAKGQKQARS
jgi:MFS family permease